MSAKESVTPESSTADTAKTDMELLKLRFDFAWKHFDFHAKQRTTMFQYFATVLPLIVAAYFYFLKERSTQSLLAESLIVIALTGMTFSIVFGLLDIRNRLLYRVSEFNLKLLESNYLYRIPLDGFPGIITHENNLYGSKYRYHIFKFRFLMGCIYIGATFLFAWMAFYAFCCLKGWFGWELISPTPSSSAPPVFSAE